MWGGVRYTCSRRHLLAAFQNCCNQCTSLYFAILEQHFKVSQPRVRISPSSSSISKSKTTLQLTLICSHMACMTISSRSNEFASKWPRFSSTINWKRFQRSWRWILGEKQLRGIVRNSQWSILSLDWIRGQSYTSDRLFYIWRVIPTFSLSPKREVHPPPVQKEWLCFRDTFACMSRQMVCSSIKLEQQSSLTYFFCLAIDF